MHLTEIFFLLLSICTNFLIFKNIDLFKKIIPIYDVPNLSRKIHKFPVPVLGGVWIALNLFITMLYLNFFNEDLLIKSFFHNLRDKFHFLLFLIIILFVGLYDDANDIKYKQKSLIFFFFCFFFLYKNEKLIIYSLRVNFIDNLYVLDLGKYSLFFSSFCLLFLLVSLNFIDGLNLNLGLFYFLSVLFLFLLSKNIFFIYLIIPIIFILYLNYRFQIFFGDSGVHVITIILAHFFINNYNQGLVTFDKLFIIFLYPTVDLIRVVTSRLIKFKNLAVGDRNHLHHILDDKYGRFIAISIIFTKNLILIFSSFFLPPLFIVITYVVIYSSLLFFVNQK